MATTPEKGYQLALLLETHHILLRLREPGIFAETEADV